MGAGGGLKHRGEPSSGEQPSEGLAPCRPEVVMDPWCGGKIHPEDPVDPHEQWKQNTGCLGIFFKDYTTLFVEGLYNKPHVLGI